MLPGERQLPWQHLKSPIHFFILLQQLFLRYYILGYRKKLLKVLYFTIYLTLLQLVP